MAERYGDDEWIAKQLKAEAERHDPDPARIRQLIRERDDDRRPGRSSWLIPAAAAIFVLVTAGAITAVYTSQSLRSPAQVQVFGQQSRSTAENSSPTTATARPSSEKPLATTSHPAKTTAEAPRSTSGTSPTTPDAPRPDVELKVASARSAQVVSLPDGAVDWIAAGSADAAQTVRSKDGGQQISGPHETGNPTSTTASGPFVLSWNGGLSEPSHTGSRTWRTVTGPVGGPETGLIIRAPAAKRVSTLVLYVGAEGADGQLRTQLGGQGKVTRTRLRAGDGGYVVTIRFHTPLSGAELTVELIGGSGGSISFAAAALR
jgi:hypothetical protein